MEKECTLYVYNAASDKNLISASKWDQFNVAGQKPTTGFQNDVVSCAALGELVRSTVLERFQMQIHFHYLVGRTNWNFKVSCHSTNSSDSFSLLLEQAHLQLAASVGVLFFYLFNGSMFLELVLIS